MRRLVQSALVALLAVATTATLVAAASTTAAAAPDQSGGADVPTWQIGWHWTYDQVFTYEDPSSSTNVTVDEQVSYSVAQLADHDGYRTYQVGLSGSITGGSGSADGYSLSGFGGSVSGTAWYAQGDLALVEEDQTQDLTATAHAGPFPVGVTASVNLDLVPTPALVTTDFRLHDGDSWFVHSTVAESGSYSYDASGLASGGSPISGQQPVDGPATVTATTDNEPIATGIAVDRDTIDDTTHGVTIVADWAPQYANVAHEQLSLPVNGSTATLTMDLVAASTPASSAALSVTLSPQTSCAGGPVTVSGTLASGQSGVTIDAVVDEDPASPGTGPTLATTTRAGGAYTVTVTAPVVADGLDKPQVRGAYAVLVSGGGARGAATLEVTDQDCSSLVLAGPTSAAEGASVTVSATLTDLATGQPIADAPVSFSLAGQSAIADTLSSGVATTQLPVAGPPSSALLTAVYDGSTADAPSSASEPFTISADPTTTRLTAAPSSPTVGQPVTFTATVSRPGPSVPAPIGGTVTFTVDGAQLGSPVAVGSDGSATSQADSTLTVGTHTVVADYSGDGNDQPSDATITVDVHPPLTATSTSLTASPQTSVFGQPVTLVATVTAASGQPDGSVEFVAGTSSLGVVQLPAQSSDTARLTVTSLAVGADQITADYLGDGDVTYAPSSSPPVTVSVSPDGTAVTVTPQVAAPVTGQDVAYTVTVSPASPGSGVPTGTVSLSVDGSPAGSPVTLQGGSAVVDGGPLTAGTHTVVATYDGDANFRASSGTTTVTVGRAVTTTVVTSSEDPSVQGQPVTFTATVTPQAPGAGEPTGQVSFTDGTTALGTASLQASSGGQDQAVLTVGDLPVGANQTISASYAGDANFAPSAATGADAVEQTVVAAPPTYDTHTTVTASVNPSVYGQPVTFTATVTSTGGTPTGPVQFSVDGQDLGGPVPLVDGVATSPAVSDLAAGGHTVIAAYAGNLAGTTVGFDPSGAIVSFTVDQAATVATVIADPNPAAYGQGATFSATLGAQPPGAGTPGGQVQFLLDGQDLGNPVPVSGGRAAVSFDQVLSPGSYTVSIITSGDPNFLGTTAQTTFTVSPVPVNQAVTIDAASPDVYGQAVVVEDIVSPAAGPGTPPTGDVTFLANGSPIGTSPLVASPFGQRAGIGTAGLAAGTYEIVAIYSGNGFYGQATSSPVMLVVHPAPTTISASPAVLSGTTLTATLRNAATGRPVAGQPLLFVAGSTVLCAASDTDADGVASCGDGAHLSAVLLAGGYTVVYRGDANYLGYGVQEGLIGQEGLLGLF